MSRILIVDDEADIRALISRYAEFDGFETASAGDGEAAIELCEKEDFDIIIMDIMMPGVDGYTACRKIKEKKDIPVIMLSARGEEYDKLFGFEVGVDDYVTKPFSPKELMARIKAVLKRHGGSSLETAAEGDRLEFGGLTINIPGREIFTDGQRQELTAKEFDLLLYLARNKGIVLTRENILNAVWGYDYFGEDRTVDWQIKLLRGKLAGYRDMIHTIRGVGYKFDD